MKDMLCLYTHSDLVLIRKIKGAKWYNLYEDGRRLKEGGWSIPERYHWLGQPCLGEWNDDC